MLIKILDTTVLSGRNVFEGDEVEADKTQAKVLIRMGKAVEVKSSAVAPAEDDLAAPKKKATKKSVKKTKKINEDKEDV